MQTQDQSSGATYGKDYSYHTKVRDHETLPEFGLCRVQRVFDKDVRTVVAHFLQYQPSKIHIFKPGTWPVMYSLG
jgi:hypothetical protein